MAVRPVPLVTDPSVRAVWWKDLVDLPTRATVRELLLPVPWFILILVAARPGWMPVAAIGAFYFFLTGLRLVHDVFHGNLGLPRWANHMVLSALSGLMLGSMHAVRITHLRHHRDCLGPDDTEGATARRTALGALLTAPLFPFALHFAAYRHASRSQRRWIVVDLSLNAGWIAAIVKLDWRPLVLFTIAMAVGQSLSGFFAVWTVHHDCDRWHEIARTLRHRFKSVMVFNMFYHLEHHLYPKVPTCHLPALARRLDDAVPELARKAVY